MILAWQPLPKRWSIEVVHSFLIQFPAQMPPSQRTSLSDVSAVSIRPDKIDTINLLSKV